jgi:outer membrane usher protein
VAGPSYRSARRNARTRARTSALALFYVLAYFLSLPATLAREPLATEFETPVTSQLNSTGRVIMLPVPVRDDKVDVGEVVLRIGADDSVEIPKKALTSVLEGVLEPSAAGRLAALADRDGYVALAALAESGVDLELDRAALALRLRPKAEQRAPGDITLQRPTARRASSLASRPALLAGYLNVVAGIDHRWATPATPAATSGRLELFSALRFWGIVLEHDMVYDGLVDPFLCPRGAICAYAHESGLERRRSRIVHDRPEWQLRLQAGDVDVQTTALQRGSELLGIAIEKSPRKLEPGTSIRPVGRSAFFLENAAEVEVVVNGSVLHKVRLRGGRYNLTDLPLGAGSNEVVLRITDDRGAQRTLTFTQFYDASLLGAGVSEWSLAGGVLSYVSDSERRYRDEQLLATGFYRRGLSDTVTAELHAQADRRIVMGGVGVFAMTPWGVLGAEAALSEGPTGTGLALLGRLERSNVAGPFTLWTGLPESLRLGFEYRSSAFRTAGEQVVTASGVIFPEHSYWLRLDGAYSVPLPRGMALGLSGRYQFHDPAAVRLSPYSFEGDRYGVDLTLSAPIGPAVMGSLSAGWSNETSYAFLTHGRMQPDFRVMARASWRPGPGTSVSASYDSLERETTLSGRLEAGNGVGRWETSVDLEHEGRYDRGRATAQAAYWGNRLEARATHSATTTGMPWADTGVTSGDQRTSLRLGTAIAFADGAVAIGPPVRGQAFAIVEPHASLAGRRVTVGESAHVVAETDWLGPAVVTDLPAYANRTLPVDVDDLPLGYSLGQGALETHAPYRGGYRVTVGSDYSVTAVGTLLGHDGRPLALLTGVAQQPGRPEKQVAFFTNSAGRFGADGLAPGAWHLEMATEPAPTHFVIDVPAGTDGLYRAGTLQPAERGNR